MEISNADNGGVLLGLFWFSSFSQESQERKLAFYWN